MGAIAGILICDYWVIRESSVWISQALFDPDGPYSYGNGFNWRAIVALVVAIAAGRARFPARRNDARRPGRRSRVSSTRLYTYAWFVTFGLGFRSYITSMSDAGTAKGEST